MSFRENFKTISANMISSDLGLAIEDDAIDTNKKILPVAELFLTLVGLDPTDDVTDVITALYNVYGNEMTLITEDGDLVNFVLDNQGNLINTWDDQGVTRNEFIVSDGGFIHADDIDNECIHTAHGTYTWSTFQLAKSLSAQSQAAVIMQRLANLTTNPNITIADINAVLDDFNGAVTPDVYNLISSIKSIPGGVTSTSLLSILKGVYSSISGAIANDDTIEFDDTRYAVKAFNGTVVWSIIRSATTMLSTVLLYAGGAVLKIVGGGLLLLTNIIPTIMQEVGFTEEAVFDPNASQYEFCVPLYQGSIPAQYCDSDLYSYLNDYRVVKCVYPSFNLYAWINKNDDQTVKFAIYLNLLNKGNIFKTKTWSGNTYANMVFNITSTTSTEENFEVCLNLDKHMVPGYAGMPLYTNLDCFEDVTDNNENFGLIDDESEFGLRTRVTNSLAFYTYQLFNAYIAYNNLQGQFLPSGRVLYTSSKPLNQTTEQYMAAVEATFISNQSISMAMSLLAISRHYNYPLTWTTIVNYLVPFLSNLVETQGIKTTLLRAPVSTEGLISMQCAVLPALTFRGSFVIVPPHYSKGSALKAILTGVVAVAAVAIAFVATKVAVSRALTSRMTDKYIGIQRQWEELKTKYGTDEYESLKKSYLKGIRKYNLIAGLCGFSKLSAVQGWESGSSSDISSDNGLVQDGQIQTILSTLTGSDPESQTTISLADIKRLISGS